MSATGEFDYELSAYLSRKDSSPRDVLSIMLAMWKRWPDLWGRWVGSHPHDVPDVLRTELRQAGLDCVLAAA